MAVSRKMAGTSFSRPIISRIGQMLKLKESTNSRFSLTFYVELIEFHVFTDRSFKIDRPVKLCRSGRHLSRIVPVIVQKLGKTNFALMPVLLT